MHSIHLANTTPTPRRHVEHFLASLKLSGLLSVDAFLERRQEFIEVGKIAMGIELLIRENASDLWQTSENWMVYLFQAMIGSTLDDFVKNRVSFVSFNYDRTVEHFLFTSLQNTFDKTDADVARVLETLPIIHLHGKLGNLPWQDGARIVPYGEKDIDVRVVRTMSEAIKVVHEDITDGRDKDFERAKQLLNSAQRIYLLGFGFGERNVERLGLKQIEVEPQNAFDGTSYGMTQKETDDCRTLCGGRVMLHKNFACLDFLRNIARLD